MKYLFALFILVSSLAEAATCKSIRLERIYDSQGAFQKVTVWAYTDQQQGQPYVRDLTTQAQYNRLSDLLDLTAFQLSKMPDRVWVFFRDDGTIDRIDHHTLTPYLSKVTSGENVPSQLIPGILNLKSYTESLLP